MNRFLRIAAGMVTTVSLIALVGVVLVASQSDAATRPQVPDSPNVILVTVDTLRADRLSAYGYKRPTSPHMDQLLEGGARFLAARTIEPLTNPALCSMITSLHPHQHGGSRNGLRLRSGLASLPKALQARGYRTAAFVGNWTLRDKLSGLAEHFELYEEVLTRRRWMGLIRSEATADDVTARAIDWATDHMRRRPRQPFLLWVHYVEPHAPYRLHKEFVEPLGLGDRNVLPDADRYDTEIAYVDRSIGELMAGLEDAGLPDTITVLTADHGESLGEHGYWGHGRNLFEPTLRIPMGIRWPGRIEPTTIAQPAVLIDLAPTLLGLIDERPPAVFEGYDWSPVLLDGASAPVERVTRYQAHRGAVITRHDSDLRRKNGLLEVGMITDQRKEIYRIGKSKRWVFDLSVDPLELGSLSRPTEDPSEGLMAWADLVVEGLSSPDLEPVEPLDEDAAKMMETLGYVD